jgi:hypothetical protein
MTIIKIYNHHKQITFEVVGKTKTNPIPVVRDYYFENGGNPFVNFTSDIENNLDGRLCQYNVYAKIS